MSRLLFAALLAAVVALPACTSATDDPKPEISHPVHEDPPECSAELHDAFSAWEDAGFSGSIAIFAGDDTNCLAAYGWADTDAETPNTPDTVFSIGSVSKAFTAAAVLSLVDDQKLSLDDRAGDVLPGLAGAAADTTVEQLLLHTSGLTGTPGQDHEPLKRDDAVDAISELDQEFEPGTGFLYSNAGYTLLALMVEQISDRTYRQYLSERILPLPSGDVAGGFWDGDPAAPSPRAVGYREDGPTDQMGAFAGPHWALDGNGGLAMTMGNLARWTHALFTGRLLSEESTGRVGSPGFDHDDGSSETPGWIHTDASVYGVPFLTAAGGGGDIGHNTIVAWLPESRRTIAIASNTPDITAEELLQAIGPELAAGKPLPRPAPSRNDTTSSPDFAALAGTYTLGSGGSIEITTDDGQLAASALDADAAAALFPPAAGFTADDVAAHEEGVLALLRGETQEGREERTLLESDLGPIEDIELGGTIINDGELRTYVTANGSRDALTLWYALDEHGALAAAEGPAEPPTLHLVPAGGHAFKPHDPAGAGPDVTVTFGDGSLTITGPSGTTTAQPAG